MRIIDKITSLRQTGSDQRQLSTHSTSLSSSNLLLHDLLQAEQAEHDKDQADGAASSTARNKPPMPPAVASTATSTTAPPPPPSATAAPATAAPATAAPATAAAPAGSSSDPASLPASSHPSPSYFSFEFFPPKTEAGLLNLFERIDRMKNMNPLFIDVTWGAGGSTKENTVAIASYAQQYCGLDVLMHMTCTGLTRAQIISALDAAKDAGVQNILALRGDAGKGQNKWAAVPEGLSHADELVKLIREVYGDYFGIAVAGHPEGHIEGEGIDSDLTHLKQKIDAGADFIITQFFYDVDVFINYVAKCRAVGITVPIIPGIMPIQSYASFVRMTQFCKTRVASSVYEMLGPVRDDDEAVKTKGVELAADMCRQLLDAGVCDGVHFYTLNLERSVTRILEELDVLKDDSQHQNPTRRLPWRPSTLANRSKEEVRPINWANRPKSYMKRTEDWDEFPNGRWGDARSPAFGELSDSHFYRFTLGNVDDRKAMLGDAPASYDDIYQVFSDYVEGKLPLLPWCESSLQPESFTIQKELAQLNRAGFLTINSQPAVNGVDSSDSVFGWGGAGGYVYQKAYVECFCSPENLDKLMKAAENRESLTVFAINRSGDEQTLGMGETGVAALTWGVFPGKEIIQPTVFDPDLFTGVWSDEAFSLWQTMWLSLYDEDTTSYEIVETIHDSFFLVAIIDNDYIKGDNLWQCLMEAGGVR
jgi:methylenetetrahydrofolate reductase (NADPH)